MAFLATRHHRERLVLRPLPERKRSRSAVWSLRVAGFAPVLAGVSLLAHNIGMVDTPAFLVLGACVAIIALVGLVVIAAALRSLWMKGTKGGRSVIAALFFSIVTLTPYAIGTAAFFANPRQNDVSTDLVDPPLMESEARLTAVNPLAVVAADLRDGYPELSGRRYKAPPEAIEQTILAVAEARGWQLVSRRGRISADDELFFEFSYRVPVLAIPGVIVIRLADEGDTSFVDMRARTGHVPHDLGWNARLIASYLTALDFELVGIVEA
ncbi:DUF1499 domain-containing protein [Oricola thermophila]|uniref:DUF1499 domain-containing protein n=1 Tax=Oricola thermophila TaxID=2742145 RepID=A0A6N1VCK4_9HYPH|nr:DUF1499 domain-containing protein [Oricola thermophila]QKV18791.1 DUF1499 domain-containing protein [Oricola thermophila]